MNKHTLYFLVLLTSVFFLAACGLNEVKTTVTADEKRTEKAPIQHITHSKNGIALKIEKKQDKASENKMMVTILNESEFALTHGEYFAVEKNISGVWYSVPFKIKALETGKSLIHPDESLAQTVSLDPYLENDLPPGKYRLVKYFGELLDSKPDNKKNKLILAVPFKVINNGLFIH